MIAVRAPRPRLLRQLQKLRSVLRLLAPYLRPQRGALAWGAALTALLLALRLAQPWPLKWIVDGLTGADGAEVGPALASALFLAVTAAAGWVERTQVVTLVGLGNRALYAFRTDLFAHVLRQPIAFHERKGEGELLTRIVYDTTRLRKGVNHVLTRLLQTVLMFAAVVGILLFVDVMLALVMGAAGAAALWLVARGGNRVRKAARKNRKREGRLASLVAEELIAVREIQTFRPGDAHTEGFAPLNRKSLKQEGKVQRIASEMLFRVEILVSLGLAIGLWVGTQRVSAGLIGAGDLVLFASYAASLYQPFFRFARQAARMGSTAASAERLRKLMTRQPEIADAPDAVDAGTLRGEVECRQVGCRNAKGRRGTRTWALREVSFRVAPGERVAVVGANGAGKSSLLRLLLRLADPHEGEILIDGRDARSYTLASLRRQMSVVHQGAVFFGLSVRENLAIGRPGVSDAGILGAARRAGALELIEQLPDGLDTVVRRHGRTLSAGERQRLALARALLHDGPIWLLDEPTTGLDDAAAEATSGMLNEITRGRTTFWITHDPRVVGLLDRVLYLADGRVRFFGTPAEFHDWTRGLSGSTDEPPQIVALHPQLL